MVCLDSDFIINFLRNDEKTVGIFRKLKEKGVTLKTTSINGFELWKGAYRLNNEGAKNAVEKFLLSVEVIRLDEKSSRRAAEIFETLIRRGEEVDVLDVMIAAIVIGNNEELLTGNKKHFARIKDLKFLEV